MSFREYRYHRPDEDSFFCFRFYGSKPELFEKKWIYKFQAEYRRLIHSIADGSFAGTVIKLRGKTVYDDDGIAFHLKFNFMHLHEIIQAFEKKSVLGKRITKLVKK